MNDDATPTLLMPFEDEAIAQLAPELDDHLQWLPPLLFTIEQAISTLHDKGAEESPPALRVTVALFIRLGNDVRGMGLLAAIGYHDQAASIMASAFETGYTISRIAGDDEAALRWSEFDDPTRTFLPMRNLIWETFDRHAPDASQEHRATQYEVYRQLCLAKHGNPIFLRQHTYRFTREGVEMVLGPSTAETALRVSQFVLIQAIGIVTLAGGIFSKQYARHDRVLAKCLRDLTIAWDKLRSRFKERWGNQDPFPGKWRSGGDASVG